MDFELSEDQVALRDGIARLLAGRYPTDVVHGLESVRGAVDRDRWAELGDAGVFSLAMPEAEGGLGLGVADAAVVFEQLGRALVPGPLVWTLLAAGLVPGAGEGTTVVGGVAADEGPLVVEHLDALDAVVVLEGGLGIAEADAVRAVATAAAHPLDPLTPVHHLAALPESEPLGAPEGAVPRWRRRGVILTAALQVGLAAAATDLAVAYAAERHQFGRPVGSFQAVKHMAADMLTRSEVARAAVYAAAVTEDDPAVGDPERAAAVAKVAAGEAAVANGKACVQVHGGMGYTWEVDAHRYLKRAWVLDTAFGSPDHHADALAQCLA